MSSVDGPAGPEESNGGSGPVASLEDSKWISWMNPRWES